MAITYTVGLRDLIVLRADLALFVLLLPSMFMTCQWRLDTYTSFYSTTVMRPTLLASKKRRRLGPMQPAPTTRTDNDRRLC